MKAIPLNRGTIRIEAENFLELEWLGEWTNKGDIGITEISQISNNEYDLVKIAKRKPKPVPPGHYLPLSVLPAHCRECPAAPKCKNAKLGVTERERPDTCGIETF